MNAAIEIAWTALVAFLVLAAYHLAASSMRGAVLAYLNSVMGDGWVTSLRLSLVFGGGVYAVLRGLHRQGLVQRRERPDTDAKRGGRPVVWYRVVNDGTEVS